MGMNRAELIELMRPMPTEEKRTFVEQIWEEFGDELGWVDPELTPEQIAELERRLEDAKAHPEQCIPAEEVFRKLDEKYGRK